MEQNNMHIHDFKSYDIPSTCKDNGYTLHRCACGYEHKSNFKPLGVHNYRFVDQVSSTCTEAGVQNFRCAACGDTVTNAMAPLGHSWGAWKTQRFAACTEDGMQIRMCSRCQQAEEQIIPAIGHKLVNPKPSQTEEGMMEYFCENCGQTVLQPIPPKKPGFFKRYKKALIISAIVLLLAGIGAAIPLHIIPACHYMTAKNLLNDGDYINAYYALKDCKGFSNAEVLLRDFTVRYKEIITVDYDEDGNQTGFTGYKYDEQGHLISSMHYTNDGVMLYGYETTYDSNGNVIVEIDYSEGTISSKREYTYNENGGKTAEATSEYIDGALYEKTVTTFDDFGNKLTSVTYDENGEITEQYEYEYVVTYENGNVIFSDPDTSGWHDVYVYRQDGKILEYTFYAGNGDIEYQYLYEYDDQGRLIREVDNYKKGVYNGETVYEYDEYGTLIKVTERDENGILEHSEEYNSDGNLVCIKWYNDYKSEYEYDEHGNVIRYFGYNAWGEDKEKFDITTEYDYADHGIINTSKSYDKDGTLTSESTFYNPSILYQPKNSK